MVTLPAPKGSQLQLCLHCCPKLVLCDQPQRWLQPGDRDTLRGQETREPFQSPPFPPQVTRSWSPTPAPRMRTISALQAPSEQTLNSEFLHSICTLMHSTGCNPAPFCISKKNPQHCRSLCFPGSAENKNNHEYNRNLFFRVQYGE